jgi:universal stress protein A
MKFILCAVDRSTQPLEALRYAAGLAQTLSARLVLLHVDSPPHGGVLVPPSTPDEPPDEERWAAVVAAITGRKPEVHFATGDAGEEIVKFARKWRCDMIVLGSHVRSAVSLAIGSAVGKVVAHAPCTVIVVPTVSQPVEAPAPVAA